MLYFVFTIQEGDIVNCRMATPDLILAEEECINAMRTNRDRCVRIVKFDRYVQPGKTIWIDVSISYDTHRIVIKNIYDQEALLPRESEWADYLTVVSNITYKRPYFP